MADAAAAAGVAIVAGDTKVVERGKADGMYITTTGVGRRRRRASLAPASVRPGDRVLVSGPIGDHGIDDHARPRRARSRGRRRRATPAACGRWSTPCSTPAGPACAGCATPTRGGVATVLNELARRAGSAVVLDEATLPVRAGRARRLRDPRHRSAATSPTRASSSRSSRRSVADAALAALRAVPGRRAARRSSARCRRAAGRGARCGRRSAAHRVIDMLVGDPLPRIC